MKLLIVILCLITTCPVFAQTMKEACPTKYIETWKDQENRAACEAAYMARQQKPSQQQDYAAKDPGPCMGDCGSEKGICISNCNNNISCMNNCAAAQGRCVSRCY